MTENASTVAPEDSLAQYLREIGRHRLLTPAEEVELAKRIEHGDTAAKNRMIESNLRLVVFVARSYAHHGVPLLDLIQEGTLGLIRAAEGFDWRRGTKFSTYAIWWIRQAVDRAVWKQADPIRAPSQTRGARYGFTSLDAIGADTVDVADPQATDAYERVDRRLTVTVLQQLLRLLPPVQRRVIELRFGIGGDECSTERTAELLDLSPLHVSTLERDALRRLRQLTSPAALSSAA